jgi:hypothetical protein
LVEETQSFLGLMWPSFLKLVKSSFSVIEFLLIKTRIKKRTEFSSP